MKKIQYNIENNFMSHDVSSSQSDKMEMLREKSKELAYLIESVCPESREKSIAMTNLEQSVMWANASIARN